MREIKNIARKSICCNPEAFNNCYEPLVVINMPINLVNLGYALCLYVKFYA